MQPPSFPSLLPTPSSCNMHTMAGGAALGQEPSELLVDSVKQQNKELLSSVVPLHLAVSETLLLGGKVGKTHCFPPIPPCMLGKEKAHMLRKAIVPGYP